MTYTRRGDEVYALYVLGLADEAEQERICTHLSNGCISCRGAVKEALAFWYVFADATITVNQVEQIPSPTPALRRRVINCI